MKTMFNDSRQVTTKTCNIRIGEKYYIGCFETAQVGSNMHSVLIEI